MKNNIQYSFDLENWVDHSTQTNPGELRAGDPPVESVGMYFRVLVTGKGYSDNIVGYHLLEVPTGQSLLSSPQPRATTPWPRCCQPARRT